MANQDQKIQMVRVNSADELELFEEVGRGGFGVVYRGVVLSTGLQVAVKLIDLENENTDLFEVNKEIMILLECKLPQITEYYGCFVKSYKLWVVMELMDGGSLFDLLRPGPVGEEKVILIILREVLQALDYLHGQGKIHRDLKSQNILINKLGEVKLTDFGVSTQLLTNFSKRNTTVGTPYWMAPEVILNNSGGHAFKADIWSLACCGYELLTGKAPLQSQYSPMRALRQLSKCQKDSDFSDLIGLNNINDMSKDMHHFFSKCFVMNPRDRMSASQLLKHPFISKYAKETNKSKLLKNLITRKQLWEQENYVSKTQHFYIPTEISKNQQIWQAPINNPGNSSGNSPGKQKDPKSIHFNISMIRYDDIDLNSENEDLKEGPGHNHQQFGMSNNYNDSAATAVAGSRLVSPRKSRESSQSPQGIDQPVVDGLNDSNEELRSELQHELSRIVNRVFARLENRLSLGTGQYDALVALNDQLVQLVSYAQDTADNSKVLVFQYLKYFLKELRKHDSNDTRELILKLILPSNPNTMNANTVDAGSVATRSKYIGKGNVSNAHFDEIERSLLESWLQKMEDRKGAP